MKRRFAMLFRPVVLLSFLMAFLASCAQDGDGPLDVMPNGKSVDGEGFFEAATLDSGKTLHLISDTLYITLSKIWSFSDCSLSSIDLNYSFEDSCSDGEIQGEYGRLPFADVPPGHNIPDVDEWSSFEYYEYRCEK